MLLEDVLQVSIAEALVARQDNDDRYWGERYGLKLRQNPGAVFCCMTFRLGRLVYDIGTARRLADGRIEMESGRSYRPGEIHGFNVVPPEKVEAEKGRVAQLGVAA